MQLSDGTGNATMTCFSDEANSLIKDCKEIVRTMPNQNFSEYPTELLSLQGKKKIFQLHFDRESTKENRVFILDTCWDAMPVLTLPTSDTTEASVNALAKNTENQPLPLTKVEPTATLQVQQTDGTTPAKETSISTTPVNTPVIATISHANLLRAPTLSETEPAILAEQEPSPETSKPKKETARKTARKSLFTETDDAATATAPKKSKKET